MRAAPRWAGAIALACGALGCSAPAAAVEAPPADTTTPAALVDLGLALLRQPGPANAVVSPVAVASALGLLHAGLNGPAEAEIEALFGPRAPGRPPLRQRLPALLHELAGAEQAPFVLASRLWIDPSAAPAVPVAYARRLAQRYQADAVRVDFRQAEAARAEINTWTAQHTAGRVAELLPPGSVSAATRLTLSTAIHFRSPWERPFDAAQTESLPFRLDAERSQPVPTLVDERGVLQAEVSGTRLMALPFAGQAWTLLLAVPAESSSVAALVQGLDGRALATWQAALQLQKCRLALPKFDLAPKPGSLKAALQGLGVKTAFTARADLRPMLGRQARGVHLGDVVHAAGIRVDETGGEAVAATGATVQAKSFALPMPDCAVQRPFVFVVLHRASGTPLFMGRVGDPAAD